MAGESALSFAGSFGQGLGNVLLEHRRTQDDKESQAFNAAFPALIQLGLDSGDFTGAERLFTQRFPHFAKSLQKSGGFQHLLDLQKRFGPQNGGVEDAPLGEAQQQSALRNDVASVEAGASGQPQPTMAPLLQQTPQAQAQPQGHTFFGQSVLSPEDRMFRDVDTRRSVATKLGVPADQAVDYALYGTRKPVAYGASAMRYGGTLKGDQAGPDAQDVYGRPLNPNMYYRVQIQPTGDLSYTPTVAPGGNLGVDREAISRAQFGGKSFAQLTPAEQQVVLDAERQRAGQMSETRALGTETGQFKGPIDVKTAQETNTQVGTSSADYAGQQIPTAVDRERVQDLGVIRGDLTRISGLLGILPSEKTLAGVAPGAVLAARRRMNSDAGLKDKDGKPIAMSYRTGIAQLEANVDSMVNLLARVRGRSVGTQTEQDAERAYNAVVQLKAGLTNPLGGDTQESARVRIAEALAGLDRVIAQLPAAGGTPTPNKPAVAPKATAAPPNRGRGPGPVGAGVVTIGPDGKFYRDGVLDPTLNP